jgi:predicted transposase/invertase (TIGR01784 family)
LNEKWKGVFEKQILNHLSTWKGIRTNDRFFKDVLSRREAALDFVLYYLPADLAALLDIESLVVSKDSFVDKELREHFSDIIYQVDLEQGDSAYIYLLFEHKSYSDPLIALHLLRYMIKIWEQEVKQGKARPFSPIIPIVVYHGKSKWKAGPDFYALFDLPDGLKAYMPNFHLNKAVLNIWKPF